MGRQDGAPRPSTVASIHFQSRSHTSQKKAVILQKHTTLSQLQEIRAVLHPMQLSHPQVLCISTYALADSAVKPGCLSIISLHLLKSSEDDPSRPPFSVRAESVQHRGNTIFSVCNKYITLWNCLHGVLPGQIVWKPLFSVNDYEQYF